MLEKHIIDFIAYCKVAGFKPKSIQSLSLGLKHFAIFIKGQNISNIKDISYQHLSSFVADFNSPTVSVKKARVWCLHQFFHFLTLYSLVRDNIALGLPYPKIEKTVPLFLTVSEYNLLLEYFAMSANCLIGMRNLLVVLLLGTLGLRTSSIVALNIEHIYLDEAIAWISEKGGRRRFIALPEIICILLDKYINEMGLFTGPLFLSKRGKRIYSNALQGIFHNAAAKLTIDKHLHPHLFRHTAATHLNKVSGTSITQAILGHSRRANTLKYAHLNPDKYADYMVRHPYNSSAIREVSG